MKTINIFDVLKKIDEFDIEYFNNLSDEEKKDIAAYPLMKWLSGCKSSIQILQLNAFMNSTVFTLPQEHKDLLFKLACVSSDGKVKKYNWIKRPSPNKKYTATIKVLRNHYKCSTKTALSYIPLIDYVFVSSIAKEYGEQDDIIKKIKKELE
jgi:hypothetical protein